MIGDIGMENRYSIRAYKGTALEEVITILDSSRAARDISNFTLSIDKSSPLFSMGVAAIFETDGTDGRVIIRSSPGNTSFAPSGLYAAALIGTDVGNNPEKEKLASLDVFIQDLPSA